MKIIFKSTENCYRFIYQESFNETTQAAVAVKETEEGTSTETERLETALRRYAELPEDGISANALEQAIEGVVASLAERLGANAIPALERYFTDLGTPENSVPVEQINTLVSDVTDMVAEDKTLAELAALSEEDITRMQTITNMEFLEIPMLERLRYITTENVTAPEVAEGRVDRLTFTFTFDGQYNEALWHDTTAGQVLPQEVRSVTSGGQTYSRAEDSLSGEFFNGNGVRLTIHEGTHLDAINTDSEAVANVQNAINEQLENFEGTSAEKLVAAEALERGFDPEFIQLAFVEQGNEIETEDLGISEEQVLTRSYRAKLEDFLTEIDRVIDPFNTSHNEEVEGDDGRFTAPFVSAFMGSYRSGERETVMEAYGFTAEEIEETAQFATLAESGHLIDLENISPGIDGFLDIIGAAELGVGNADNYNAIVDDAGQSRIDLTNMTLREILQYQDAMMARGHSSTAIGRYQIVEGTLQGLIQRHSLNLDEKFDADLQDRLAVSLMEIRGLRAFQAGTMPAAKFQSNLAHEWASLPVDATGRAAYGGVGVNGYNALISHSVVAAQLESIRGSAQ